MAHFLFPNGDAPPAPEMASAGRACAWLIAVMDENDKRRKFVASVYLFWLDRGYLTDKQLDALRAVFGKVANDYDNGFLESLGAMPAQEDDMRIGAEVVRFPGSEGGEAI